MHIQPQSFFILYCTGILFKRINLFDPLFLNHFVNVCYVIYTATHKPLIS